MSFRRPSRSWSCRGRVVPVGAKTLVMGVLNVTPDSFSDGGAYPDVDTAVQRGLEMIRQGADIIDVGGESTRPGADSVAAAEELRRVVPVITALHEQTDTLLSIDTMKAEVAREAVEAGASIINDVSGLTYDPDIMGVVRETGVGAVLMHMRGEPRTMQGQPEYEDVLAEVSGYLQARIADCVNHGIPADRLAIDPGIGFGKRDPHNARLLAGLDRIAGLGCPVVIGVSRKSFLGRTLDREVDERLAGSLAAAAYAITRGADIIRVHDVMDSCDVARIVDMLLAEEHSDVSMESDTYSGVERST